MKLSDMLQRMCHTILSAGDLKAIVKSRGLPAAASNPGILTGLFLTEQGLTQAFQSLDRNEIAALHLLKTIAAPVPISFFERVYKPTGGRYGTYTQNYQGVLAKVKERLVRAGVLLMADAPSRGDEAKMELWRFALPVQFHAHLPPLFDAPRVLDDPGRSRPEVLREKLIADLRESAVSAKPEAMPRFQLAAGELHLGESRFGEKRIRELQLALWSPLLNPPSKSVRPPEANSIEPPRAAYQLLGALNENQWVEPETLADLVQTFSQRTVDSPTLCDAGWQVGALAKLEADGKTWYRLAPADPILAPQAYLQALDADSAVAVDLSLVPYGAFDLLAQLGTLRVNPHRAASLLLSSDLVRIGRAGDEALTSDVAIWLFEKSAAFQQARETLAERRGKTVLHENLLIARVTDLTLRVALEKFLGDRWISLKNDFAAFPREALGDVQRIVKKSGHVIKEVAGHDR